MYSWFNILLDKQRGGQQWGSWGFVSMHWIELAQVKFV